MIVKTNFRDQVRSLLLKKMRSGNIKPGKALSLAKLSKELGVSVTPIREAFSQLESAGIIESVVNRGFIVPELNAQEARELYELIALLESGAILVSQFDQQHIKSLKQQQKVIEKTTTGIDRINADIDFHGLLISAHKNSLVHKIVAEMKVRIFFYEMEFMNDDEFHSDSDDHHNRIISHIENGQLQLAADTVKTNWLQILEYMKK